MAQKPQLDTSRLRGKMSEKRITQAEMAQKLGMDASTFYRKMTGKSDFSVLEAISIIRILGGGSLDDYFFIS